MRLVINTVPTKSQSEEHIMRPFMNKTFSLFFCTGVAFCSCSSPGFAQGPSPAATKNRFHVTLIQPPPKTGLPGTDTIAQGSAVAGAEANFFKSDPTFANCVAPGSCKWSVNPWPFDDMTFDLNSGVISGTPKTARRVTVGVVAIDANGETHEKKGVIEVTPAKVTILTIDADIPAYPTGEPINEVLQAYGGTGNYLWSPVTTTPPLPTGVTLNANGVLSGMATIAGTYKFPVKVTDTTAGTSATADLTLVVNPAPDCGNAKYTNPSSRYFKGLFPLSSKIVIHPLENSPLGHQKQLPTENDVQCFYSTSGLVSVVGKVQYLYGFGGGANTISADLVSVQMPSPVGVQVSFGSSVTGGGTGTPSSTSGGQTQPTVTAAHQSVEAGGNFFIHVLYPLGQYTSSHLSAYAYVDPKVGFGFNGFAGQATLSQGTEQYFSLPLETYVSYDGIGHTGGVYFDYRGGLQSVPGSFAASAGLSKNNFMLNQLTFGFNFVGLVRIGAQRFFGPPAAFNAGSASASSFNKWHLVLQLSPKGS